MSETTPIVEWPDAEKYLKVFFPQYFDPDDPMYVEPDILDFIYEMALEAVPWCLRQTLKNYACALYMAYLIQVRSETSSGQAGTNVAGPVTSEREGDIQITYADLTKTGMAITERPPSDPWDAWRRLWDRCARAAIITRFGDPIDKQNALEITTRHKAKVIEHARNESRSESTGETSGHSSISSC